MNADQFGCRASAAEPFVVQYKARRLDQINADAEAGAEPKYGADIARDIGLKEG